MNLEYTRAELSDWQKLDRLMGDTRNPVIMQAFENGPGLYLDLECSKTDTDMKKNLREAFFETYELSLDDVERMHQYVKQQVRTLGRQLLDEVTAAIIPETEEPT